MPELEMPICQVCEKNKSVGVACVPGVPYSAAYCVECLRADAHPLFVLITNTASLGGLDQSAEWWREIVDHSLTHLGKSREWFDAEVKKTMREME